MNDLSDANMLFSDWASDLKEGVLSLIISAGAD
jgi:hypothetical protein